MARARARCDTRVVRCGRTLVTGMPPRRKKRRKVKRRSSTPRVQVPRICSAELSALLAEGTESRTALRLTLGDAVKRLWAYAKPKGLQDGRTLNCDRHMRRIFEVPSLTMFEVSGALSAHMRGASTSASSSASVSSSSAASSSSSAPSSSNAELLTLSPALTSMLCGSVDGRGGGSRQLTLTLAEALRLVGKYITRHGLRDATDRRRIHCDAALAEIVGKSSFTVFEAKALLASHMSKRESAASSGPAVVGGDSAESGEEESGEEENGEESEASSVDDGQLPGAGDGAGECKRLPAGCKAAQATEATEAGPSHTAHSSTAGSSADSGAMRTNSRWECQHCTLLNNAADADCAACTLPRDDPRGSIAIATVWPAPAANAASSDDGGSGGGSGALAATVPDAEQAAARNKKKRKARELPSEYVCPITQSVMVDPVSTEDGHTYERSAIARWLAKKRTSPLTGAALRTTTLVPNIALRKLIEEHRSKHPSVE